MTDNPGHFDVDDAKKLARFYRQQSNRSGNRPGRPRRRVGTGMQLRLANTDEAISVGSFGVVTIYDDTQNPPIATTQKETASLGFLHQSSIGAGVNVLIARLPGGWRIIDVVGTSQGDDGHGGPFTCCECVNSKLWVTLEFADLFGYRYIEFPEPVVSSSQITHQIEIYCLDDITQKTIVTLPALECASIDCQIHDLTGTTLNDKDIGKIYFGNSETCSLATGCLAPESSTRASGSSNGAAYTNSPAVVGAKTTGWTAFEFEVTYAMLAAGTSPRVSVVFPGNAHQWIHFFSGGSQFDGGTAWAATTGSDSTTWMAGDVAKMRVERLNTDTLTDEFRCTLYKNGTSYWTGDTDSATVTTPIDTRLGFCGVGGAGVDSSPTTTQFTNASNAMKY